MKTLSSWSSPSASWEDTRPLRRIIVIGLLVMVAAGSATAGAVDIDGVDENHILITLPIYISSLMTVGGACFLLGRWTKAREGAHDDLARDNRAMAKRIAEIELLLQAHGHRQDNLDTP